MSDGPSFKEAVVSGFGKAMASPLSRHALLVLAIAVFLGIGWSYFSNYAEQTTKALAGELESTLKAAELPVTDVYSLTAPQRERLQEQFDLLGARARHHLIALSMFYKNQYLSLAMALLAGFGASICVTAMSKSGWQNANSFLMTTLVVLLGVATFYGLFPAVFRQSENISENRERLVIYMNERESVRTFVRLGCDPMPADKPGVCVDAFIRALDARLEKVNSINIGFDAPAVSGLVQSLQQGTLKDSGRAPAPAKSE